MDHETLESVLDNHRLPNGIAWPMPLLLQSHEAQISGLAKGERIALCDDAGEIHAVLDITEIYRLNLEISHNAGSGLHRPHTPALLAF